MLRSSVGPLVDHRNAPLLWAAAEEEEGTLLPRALFTAMLQARQLQQFVALHWRRRDNGGVSVPRVMLSRALRFRLLAFSDAWLAPLHEAVLHHLEECRGITLRPSAPALDTAVTQVIDAVTDLFQVFCDCVRSHCPSAVVGMCWDIAELSSDDREEVCLELLFMTLLPAAILEGGVSVFSATPEHSRRVDGGRVRFAQVAKAVLGGKVFTRDVVMARIVKGVSERALPVVRSVTASMAWDTPPKEYDDEEWSIESDQANAAETYISSFVATHHQSLFDILETNREHYASSFAVLRDTILAVSQQ